MLTTLLAQFKLSKVQAPSREDERVLLMSKIDYANIVGSIMYAMLYTISNLAYSISIMSWFVENPSKVHWHALKWVMMYISCSLDLGLIYKGRNFESNVFGYLDANYASCLGTRKSISC